MDLNWKGIPLSSIINHFNPNPDWKWFIQSSLDGYTNSIPRDAVEKDAFLAFEVDGEPIPIDHGVVRIISPNRNTNIHTLLTKVYGSKSAKFLKSIEFSIDPKPGFWETRGYHERGNVWLEERLDERPRGNVSLETLLQECDGETLNLSGLGLEEIPKEVFEMTNLSVLYLNSNKLKTLPDELFSLTRLMILGINSNEITSIPPSIGNLKGLDELYAANNKIQSLPKEIGKLRDAILLSMS